MLKCKLMLILLLLPIRVLLGNLIQYLYVILIEICLFTVYRKNTNIPSKRERNRTHYRRQVHVLRNE